jgi:hypothetical protein
MFASMPVFGIITASDMPTGPAQSKMDPRVTDGQTLLAALAGWRNGLNRIEMRALLTSFRHGRSPGKTRMRPRMATLAPDQRREAVAKLNEKPILALTMSLSRDHDPTSHFYPIDLTDGDRETRTLDLGIMGAELGR